MLKSSRDINQNVRVLGVCNMACGSHDRLTGDSIECMAEASRLVQLARSIGPTHRLKLKIHQNNEMKNRLGKLLSFDSCRPDDDDDLMQNTMYFSHAI